jgi:hypothetical protein
MDVRWERGSDEGGVVAAELECRAASLIADVALIAEDSVLLVRYKDVEQYDGETGWFLPDDEMHAWSTQVERRCGSRRNRSAWISRPPVWGWSNRSRGTAGPGICRSTTRPVPAIPELEPSETILATQWFPLEELPPRSEVAHNGWALTVLQKIQRGAAASQIEG